MNPGKGETFEIIDKHVLDRRQITWKRKCFYNTHSWLWFAKSHTQNSVWRLRQMSAAAVLCTARFTNIGPWTVPGVCFRLRITKILSPFLSLQCAFAKLSKRILFYFDKGFCLFFVNSFSQVGQSLRRERAIFEIDCEIYCNVSVSRKSFILSLILTLRQLSVLRYFIHQSK